MYLVCYYLYKNGGKYIGIYVKMLWKDKFKINSSDYMRR